MKKFSDAFRCSFKELTDLRCILVTGLLIALSMIIESQTVNLGFTKINFAFLAIAAIGMLYGPVVGFAAGAICDIVGYIAYPDGGFLPLYILIGAAQGLLYGSIAYHRFATRPLYITIREKQYDLAIIGRLFIARTIDVLIINLICNTAANYHYGFLASESSLMVAIYGRIAKNLIELPVDLLLMALILPAVLKAHNIVFLKKRGAA